MYTAKLSPRSNALNLIRSTKFKDSAHSGNVARLRGKLDHVSESLDEITRRHGEAMALSAGYTHTGFTVFQRTFLHQKLLGMDSLTLVEGVRKFNSAGLIDILLVLPAATAGDNKSPRV